MEHKQLWYLFLLLFCSYYKSDYFRTHFGHSFKIFKTLYDAHIILYYEKALFPSRLNIQNMFPSFKMLYVLPRKIFLKVFILFLAASTCFVEFNIFFPCKIMGIFYLLVTEMARKRPVKYCWIWTSYECMMLVHKFYVLCVLGRVYEW